MKTSLALVALLAAAPAAAMTWQEQRDQRFQDQLNEDLTQANHDFHFRRQNMRDVARVNFDQQKYTLQMSREHHFGEKRQGHRQESCDAFAGRVFAMGHLDEERKQQVVDNFFARMGCIHGSTAVSYAVISQGQCKNRITTIEECEKAGNEKGFPFQGPNGMGAPTGCWVSVGGRSFWQAAKTNSVANPSNYRSLCIGDEWVNPPPPVHSMVTSGFCPKPVETKEECEEAAFAINNLFRAGGWSVWPAGCVKRSNRVYWNSWSASTVEAGIGSYGSPALLCRN